MNADKAQNREYHEKVPYSPILIDNAPCSCTRDVKKKCFSFIAQCSMYTFVITENVTSNKFVRFEHVFCAKRSQTNHMKAISHDETHVKTKAQRNQKWNQIWRDLKRHQSNSSTISKALKENHSNIDTLGLYDLPHDSIHSALRPILCFLISFSSSSTRRLFPLFLFSFLFLLLPLHICASNEPKMRNENKGNEQSFKINKYELRTRIPTEKRKERRME